MQHRCPQHTHHTVTTGEKPRSQKETDKPPDKQMYLDENPTAPKVPKNLGTYRKTSATNGRKTSLPECSSRLQNKTSKQQMPTKKQSKQTSKQRNNRANRHQNTYKHYTQHTLILCNLKLHMHTNQNRKEAANENHNIIAHAQSNWNSAIVWISVTKTYCSRAWM